MLGNTIEAIERAMWRRETRRRRLEFAWGLEALGGDFRAQDPRRFLHAYAERAVAGSEEFFRTEAAPWYQLHARTLTFPSALESPYPENNLVSGQWFPATPARNGNAVGPRRAVVVLPHWNAQPEAHTAAARLLARLGVSALRLSLPYHDERMPVGLERADYMVSSNIGLTLQASRQAVLDVRRAVRWLEQEGYARIGILGTSIGSAVGFVALAHEPALRAGAFLHVSTYFGDVVRTGLTTSHVWEALSEEVSAEEIRHFWSPISPYPYVGRLRGTGKKLLMISGRYDLSFPWELSQQLWRKLEEEGVPYERALLPCGHYTLAKPPFSYWAGLRFVPFLLRALS